MKILAAADIHGSQYRLNMILEYIKKFSPDLIVICGDITQFGPGDVAKNFLDQIPIDTLAVTGNIDTEDVSDSIEKSNADYLHLKKIIKKGIQFVGINGVKPSETTLFLTDEEKKDWINEKTVVRTRQN